MSSFRVSLVIGNEFWRLSRSVVQASCILLLLTEIGLGHEDTLSSSQSIEQWNDQSLIVRQEQISGLEQRLGICQLDAEVREMDSEVSMPAVIRLSITSSGEFIPLQNQIDRGNGWYAVDASPTLAVPCGGITIEAFRGLATSVARKTIDLRRGISKTAEVRLRRFYDSRSTGHYSANTHLHLHDLSVDDARRYLRVVSQADTIDLLFLSYLRRTNVRDSIRHERTYTSNQIVQDSFGPAGFGSLLRSGTIFGSGQEHRHNLVAPNGPYDEGYGHVLLLNTGKLIRPVSLGPVLMGEGNDDVPLQTGIEKAHEAGGTVIWAHNGGGAEDLPNWIAGNIDAQNIFDGSTSGDYEQTFYRYLNLGYRVPFSTGTDWFIYDFNRTFVFVDGENSIESWLDGLRSGRSYITNNTFLEFNAGDADVGDTLVIDAPETIKLRGKGIGRADFEKIEVIHNGVVVCDEESHAETGYFNAEIECAIRVDSPGWLGLRISRSRARTELDYPLFAHTSPIYIEFGGRRIFRPDVALDLVSELLDSVNDIRSRAKFSSQNRQSELLSIYEDAVADLEDQLDRSKLP